MSSEVPRQIVAAIYVRTSSPNQRFNHSIEEQIDSCWNFCNQRGWLVKYVFIDECMSGETIERPKFKLMLEKAKSHAFDVIVFWKLDRLCRSLVDLVNVERMLRGWGIGLCSVTEYIDTTTSIGRFNFRSIANVAELEREIIGERSRLGHHSLARKHKWPNPHPPLGYDKDEEGELVQNNNEIDIVQRIFRRYLDCKNMPQIAFELNGAGILTKKGRKWNARGVRDILTDEIYLGRYKVAGVNDHVEKYRILDDDIFNKANKIRLKHKHFKRKPMPENRRLEKIENIFNKYFAIIKGSGVEKIGTK